MSPHKPHERSIDPRRTALLIVDVQNDFVHPEGVYARHGVSSSDAGDLPRRLKPVAAAVRRRHGWIVATQMTIVPARKGAGFIPEHLRNSRPFLTAGDLNPGTWGHQLANELAPADLHVEKIATSGFYMTRLEWALRQAKVDTLLVAGLTTHLSVVATVRDALVRDFAVMVLSDCCASYDHDLHLGGLQELAGLTQLLASRDAADLLG